ncbi:MAG: hypothetical protein AAF401_10430 [Pseudomonadota bacterium]
MSDTLAILEHIGSIGEKIGSAVGTARDISKIFRSGDKAGVEAEAFNLVLDLQNKLIEVNESHLVLKGDLEALVRENAELKNEQADFDRYALTATEGGARLYRLKPGCEAGEPDHYICPKCITDRVKSILQPNGTQVECPRCGGLFQSEAQVVADPRVGRRGHWQGN